MPTERVVELTAAETHPLRASVLRAGTLSTDVRFDDDDRPDTVHLGITIDEAVVAISTWIRRPHPDHPHLVAVQLRGMATDPALRGRGLGRRLLQAGIERVAADGVELVWARARDTALEFYLAHGFATFGRGYTDLSTGLAHHDVVRRLTDPVSPG
jgi:GNAT superfamily N-acetyltransferase